MLESVLVYLEPAALALDLPPRPGEYICCLSSHMQKDVFVAGDIIPLEGHVLERLS